MLKRNLAQKIAGKAPTLLVLLLLATIPAAAADLEEDFSSDPLAKGWRIFGDESLFQWNETNANLEVTWDSSRTNSFYYYKFPTAMTDHDDFSLAFDLKLDDIAIGTTEGRNSVFQIAVSFHSFKQATRTNFFAGSGTSPTYGGKDIVEWNYFPAFSSFGETITPIINTSDSVYYYSHEIGREMDTNAVFRISLSYDGDARNLSMQMTRDGEPFGPEKTIPSDAGEFLSGIDEADDFNLDMVAISSYSDAIQIGPQQFWGSVLAHGTIDNLLVEYPDSLGIASFEQNEGTQQIKFPARNRWTYTLQRIESLPFDGASNQWTNVASEQAQENGILTLIDSNPLGGNFFYRVVGLPL